MGRTARAFNVSIVGGDTIKTEKIVINVALLGLVEKKNLITRDGAKPGGRHKGQRAQKSGRGKDGSQLLGFIGRR